MMKTKRCFGMKPVYYFFAAFIAVVCLVVPDAVLAAGQSADLLVVVADDRGAGIFAKFWIDQYNTSPYMFGFWCTIFVAGLGVVLGFIADQLMKLTGLDLTSRDIVEH